ncbi:unnamed protein product [Paramecium pentaurelia]|uniref:Uncharacterized protein n=1 Tax=Paramecium pentaurelia TaxID=43138 RepID=A0A8S1YJ72_9CILI|nr:unnamed protein product [Paramecium pentaurelia]
MGEELILKILDVNPLTSLSSVGNIIKPTGEWLTKERETKILIDFGNAIITQISIQNFNADQVNITLKGENCDDLYFDKVIWKKNAEWNEKCSIEIEPESQQVFYQMMVEVLNYGQEVYKGLKRIRVFGIQDEQLYNERKNNVKQLNKQSKNKQQHKRDSQEKNDQKEKQQKIKIIESSIKKNNQWGQYNKVQNQNTKEFVFIDPREKLRNIHKSPSPIKEEIMQFNQNTIQTPKQSESSIKHGCSINEKNMIKYNLNQIDKQFLELHQELQKSSGIGKEMQLNFANFEVYWLQ